MIGFLQCIFLGYSRLRRGIFASLLILFNIFSQGMSHSSTNLHSFLPLWNSLHLQNFTSYLHFRRWYISCWNACTSHWSPCELASCTTDFNYYDLTFWWQTYVLLFEMVITLLVIPLTFWVTFIYLHLIMHLFPLLLCHYFEKEKCVCLHFGWR